ncbi:MAG: hypothetical protein K2L42_03535 [Clostridia bacterium]|nr:hypothetical protein [Clostridia bacterium]
MSANIYPKTKTLKADVLAAGGAVFTQCYLKGGIVYPALTARRLETDCPAGVTFAGYAEKPEKLFVLAADGLYYSNDGSGFNKSQTEFAAQAPFLFDKQDGTNEAYLAGDASLVHIKPSSNTVLPFDCGIYGGIIKNGRLFALDKDDGYKIRWSGENGGTDWTEAVNGAGWARVYPERGKILNLVVFKQKIAVVCENGLALLSAFGAPENYKLVYIDGVTGKIYKNTAYAAAGKLCFYTKDGLYYFDGVKIEKSQLPLSETITEPVCAFSYEGKYLLSGYGAGLKKNCVLVFDLQKNAGYVVDKNVSAVCMYKKPYCFGADGVSVLEQGGSVCFESGTIDFGTHKRKFLKSVYIEGALGVEVEVTDGVKTRIFTGVNGFCRPNMSGTGFKISVRASGQIRGITAVAEVADGV